MVARRRPPFHTAPAETRAPQAFANVHTSDTILDTNGAHKRRPHHFLSQAAFGRTTAEAYDTEESCLDCTAPDCAYRVNSVSNGVLACSIAESSTPIGCRPQIVLPARGSRA